MEIQIDINPTAVTEGMIVTLKAHPPAAGYTYKYSWSLKGHALVLADPPEAQHESEVHWDTTGLTPGASTIQVLATLEPEDQEVKPKRAKQGTGERLVAVNPRPLSRGDVLPVSLGRTATVATDDLALWVVIRKSTDAMGFENYRKFMDIVLCGAKIEDQDFSSYEEKKICEKINTFDNRLRDKHFLPFNDVEAYRMLKVATEAFVMVNCGVALENFPFIGADQNDLISRVNLDGRPIVLDELWKQYLSTVNGNGSLTLPYLAVIRNKLSDQPLIRPMLEDTDLPDCVGILRNKLTHPCLLELIWSYWHEEGMLVQTQNVISRRFQNVRGAGKPDPLVNMEIDPLRPLNNLLWGYIQDEQHRLSVTRRAYEYSHHYGFNLYGKALPKMRPADNRSKFLEAFHNILHLCWMFYQQDDDTTVVADGFPVLNALKEVHLLLTQGMHNQFGDLPSTARLEMLMQQWLLGRPETREFLAVRRMVAYPERWMDAVDAMKRIQRGWSQTSILHFRNLAVFGERLLLSIRFGNWNDIQNKAQAENWTRYWREEIQGYIHAYRAATGVDLTADRVDATLPSILLRNRLNEQRAVV